MKCRRGHVQFSRVQNARLIPTQPCRMLLDSVRTNHSSLHLPAKRALWPWQLRQRYTRAQLLMTRMNRCIRPNAEPLTDIV